MTSRSEMAEEWSEMEPKQELVARAAEIVSVLDDDNPPELDVELLRHVLLWARKSHEVPDEFAMNWNQNVWLTIPIEKGPDMSTDVYAMREPRVEEGFCNTAGCIAGRVAIERGTPSWTLVVPEDEDDGGIQWSAENVVDANGNLLSLADFSRDELGLTDWEANRLFEWGNTIEYIEWFSQVCCTRRGLEF